MKWIIVHFTTKEYFGEILGKHLTWNSLWSTYNCAARPYWSNLTVPVLVYQLHEVQNNSCWLWREYCDNCTLLVCPVVDAHVHNSWNHLFSSAQLKPDSCTLSAMCLSQAQAEGCWNVTAAHFTIQASCDIPNPVFTNRSEKAKWLRCVYMCEREHVEFEGRIAAVVYKSFQTLKFTLIKLWCTTRKAHFYIAQEVGNVHVCVNGIFSEYSAVRKSFKIDWE